MSKDYWLNLIEDHFEQRVGDADDRWSELRENFQLTQQVNAFEEYDGLNQDGAKFMVLLVNLPLLVRGAAVHMRCLDDIFSLRVPNIYKL